MKRLGAYVTVVVTGLALLVLDSTVGAADDSVAISAVDVSNPDHAVVEFTAPAALTDGSLTADQVTLTENGVVVPTTMSVVPTAGLEVVLAIDTSGSMKENGAMPEAIAAARHFLEVLPAEVPVGVVSFADEPHLVSALTLDRGALADQIAALTPGGETALYDALVLSRSVFSGATGDRQIVLFSDGGNTVGSAISADALAVATDVRTNVVALTSSEADPAALQQLADAGHGSLSASTDPAALTGLFDDIATSLVHRYRLEFVAGPDGAAQYVVTVTTSGGLLSAAAADTVVARGATVPVGTAPSGDGQPTEVPTSAATMPARGGVGGGGGPTSSTWLLVGSAATFLAILLAALSIRRNPTAARATALAPRRAVANVAIGEPVSGVGGRVEAAADRLLRGDRRHGLAVALEVADISLRPGEFVVLAVCGGLVLALLLSTVMGWFGFVLGVVAAPLLARAWVSHRADRRRRAFDEQLPDTLQLVVSLLRAGYGLPQALDAMSHQVPEPSAGEFRRVLLEVRIGRDPSDALAATAERMRSRDFRWVVSAIHINREVGGELASILESVAETVRERQRLARQVRSLTAEGRLSALLLIALPPLLVVLLSILSPGYFHPMTESPGPFLVVLGVLMLLTGWLWMRHLVKQHT